MQPDEFGDTTGKLGASSDIASKCATLGFRKPTHEHEDRLTQWLAAEVCPTELGEERQRGALLAHCQRMSGRAPSRVDRLLAAARPAAEQRFCAQMVDRLQAKAVGPAGGAGHDGAG